MNRNAMRSLVMAVLTAALLVSGVRADEGPDFTTRPGSVYYLTGLADGSSAKLDIVVIEKIKNLDSGVKYFTVYDQFSYTNKIIVITVPNISLRPGQTINIPSGTLTTLANGRRAVVSPTVLGYAGDNNQLLIYPGVIKGPEPITWQNYIDLTVNGDPGSALITSGSTEPNTDPPPSPVYCPQISDALNGTGEMSEAESVRLMDYGDFVEYPEELFDKPIVSVDSVGGSFLMGEDDSDQTLTVFWTGCLTGTVDTSQRVCEVVGQLREGDDGIDVLCVDSGPGYDAQDGSGYIVVDASGTCAQAKTLPDSAGITLGTSSQGKIVTCVLSSDTFYIEEDNRSCGIKVVGSNTLNAGDRAYVVGTMATDSNGERYVSASPVTSAGTGLVRPLGMPNKMVGGGNFFYDVATGKGQRGVVKPNGLPCAGLNNIGLLVKTWAG